MSVNTHFVAERDIQVIKTGRVEKQTIFFDGAIQTPTEIIRNIINSQEPFQAYRDYVLSVCKDYVEFIYAGDDFWNLRDPVGEIVKNDGLERVKEFDEWLKFCDENGYMVTVEAR